MQTGSPSNLALKESKDLLKTGKLQLALQRLQPALDQNPADPRLWHLASVIHETGGGLRAAVQAARRAVSLSGAEPLFLLQLGKLYAKMGEQRQALEIAGLAEKRVQRDAAHLNTLGSIYSNCDDQDAACRCFEKSVKLDPNGTGIWFNLATSQRFFGDIEAAELSCEKALAGSPEDYQVYYLRSDLRTWTEDRNHVDELRRVLQRPGLDRRAKVFLQYALAKEYEDLGDYDQSFSALNAGADLQRAGMKYNVQDDVDAIDAVIRTFDEDWQRGLEGGHSSKEPLFVLGLPRSGTTLVERILGAHSAVFAAGELNQFAKCLVGMVTAQKGQNLTGRAAFVEASRTVDFTTLGADYIESTRPRTGNNAHFVDKMPLNFLYCGLIKAALPGAKLVHVQRDPMDSCYAMYKAMFTGAYPFSYDLRELGTYFAAYRRLMTHWEDRLGDQIYQLKYENLIESQEEETRRLLAFCDLTFEENCLNFNRASAPSSTASAVQVRRPLYRSSIGKWKHVRQYLEPLQETLSQHGVEFNP